MPSNAKTTKAAAEQEPQVSAGFGRKTTNAELVTLPSSNRVRVRRPGLDMLLREGVIDSFDGISSIVQNETIPKAKGQPQVSKKQVDTLLKDPKTIIQFMETLDSIAVSCIVEPTILPVPKPLDETGKPIEKPTPAQVDALRDDEASYVDYIDFEDKMFVMNFAVGGTRDFEEFRKESEAALGGLHDGEGNGDPAA